MSLGIDLEAAPEEELGIPDVMMVRLYARRASTLRRLLPDALQKTNTYVRIKGWRKA